MALFSNIAELKKYNASINAGVIFETILPVINFVEDSEIVPLIGPAMYEALHDAYAATLDEDSDEVAELEDAALAALLDKVRKVLTPLCVLQYKNSIVAQISDAGAVEKSAEAGDPVRMWVSNLHSETLLSEAMKATDMLLAFLEANKDDYPDWVNSEAYTELTSNILQTTKQFNSVVYINGSRIFFKAISADVRHVEETVIVERIGDAMYNRLLDGLNDGTLSNAEKGAVKLIISTVANLAIAKSSLPIIFGNDAVYKVYSESQYSGNRNNKAAPSASEMAVLKEQFNRRGLQSLDRLITYMNTTASVAVLSAYYNTPLYKNPNQGPEGSINDNLKNIFVL